MRTERYGRADKYEKPNSFFSQFVNSATNTVCTEFKADNMSEKQKLEQSTECFRTLPEKKNTNAPSRHPTNPARKISNYSHVFVIFHILNTSRQTNMCYLFFPTACSFSCYTYNVILKCCHTYCKLYRKCRHKRRST